MILGTRIVILNITVMLHQEVFISLILESSSIRIEIKQGFFLTIGLPGKSAIQMIIFLSSHNNLDFNGHTLVLFLFCVYLCVLRFEPRASHVVALHPATEVHLQTFKFFLHFEIESWKIAQDGVELVIFLPQPLKQLRLKECTTYYDEPAQWFQSLTGSKLCGLIFKARFNEPCHLK